MHSTPGSTIATLSGRRFTSSFRVSKDRVQEYLTVLNEGNPFYQHTQQSSAFDLIAPPAFVVVYLYQAVTQLFNDPVFKSQGRCVLHGEQKVEFDNVVKVGDTIDTTMTVGSVTAQDSDGERSRDIMELQFVSRNQHEKVVTRAMTVLFLRAGTSDG
ncbi:MAG: MaoC family dehydratase N-terminal domain-containing protein [Fidelibacterota bacterium]